MAGGCNSEGSSRYRRGDARFLIPCSANSSVTKWEVQHRQRDPRAKAHIATRAVITVAVPLRPSSELKSIQWTPTLAGPFFHFFISPCLWNSYPSSSSCFAQCCREDSLASEPTSTQSEIASYAYSRWGWTVEDQRGGHPRWNQWVRSITVGTHYW